jgi:hypothetical protein
LGVFHKSFSINNLEKTIFCPKGLTKGVGIPYNRGMKGTLKISEFIRLREEEMKILQSGRVPKKGEGCDLVLIENPVVRETAKAIGFDGKKFNLAGNLVNAIVWLPKSQLLEAVNDTFENFDGGFFAPSWLVRQSENNGFTLFE